jgi:predicted dehydrogenase
MTPPVPAEPSSSNTSRRDLLKRAAALAGAGAVLGSPALGRLREGEAVPIAKPRPSLKDDDPIRVGLIGTGGMGGGHIDAFLGFRKRGEINLDVVALSDVCQPRLDGALAKCRERQEGVQVDGFRDYEELLARDDVHCVLIASPEHWHAQMASDAIAAGKDVYLEKPMTLHLDDALRLWKTVRANDMRLQVGTQKMMLQPYVEARKLIEEGAIGHPTLSQTSYCRNTPDGEWNYYGIDENVDPANGNIDWERWCGPKGVHPWDTKVYHRWRRYRTWSTGIIGDLLVHQMTPMMFALQRGWPIRVSAHGGHYIDKDMENHDQVMLMVEFEKDHTMIVAGSTINATGIEPMIRGNRANIYLGGSDCVLRPESPYVDDVDPQTIQCTQIRDQDELRKDWLGCVRSRDEVRSTVELGLKHMVIVDLATKALWQNGTWEFDPQTLRAART